MSARTYISGESLYSSSLESNGAVDVVRTLSVLSQVNEKGLDNILGMENSHIGFVKLCQKIPIDDIRDFLLPYANAVKGNSDLNLWYDIFNDLLGFQSVSVRAPEMEAVEVQLVSGDDRLYYDALGTKNCTWYGTIKTDGGYTDRVVMTLECSYVSSELTLKIKYGNFNSNVVIRRDGYISVVSLMELFQPCRAAIEDVCSLAKELGGIEFRVSVESMSVCEPSGDKLINVDKESGLVYFGSYITAVGTQADKERFDELLDYLHIQKDTLRWKLISNEELSLAGANNAMGEFLGTLTVRKDYGCLMYFAWLAEQHFWLEGWRGGAGMKDWMRVPLDEDLLSVTNKIDYYAWYNLGSGVEILVSSVGFLRLDGGLNEPISLSWLSLETMYDYCDISVNTKDLDVTKDVKRQGEGVYKFYYDRSTKLLHLLLLLDWGVLESKVLGQPSIWQGDNTTLYGRLWNTPTKQIALGTVSPMAFQGTIYGCDGKTFSAVTKKTRELLAELEYLISELNRKAVDVKVCTARVAGEKLTEENFKDMETILSEIPNDNKYGFHSIQ